ncbi:MAG: alpha/beta hydrolase [Bacteroidia bacterium]
MSFKSLFPVLICCLGTFVLYGQDTGEAFDIGSRFSLQSEILDEARPYIISLPEGYEEGEKSYPVMYLLDAEGNFHHTTASVIFLARGKRIPEMIVVGIPNTDHRTRDLTPEGANTKADFPTSGGADNMLAFIEKELMPAINEKYRTTDYKMLVGHSFGGLFAIHTMLNHPGIFDTYLAISPSLWWDQQNLVKAQAEAFFDKKQDLVGDLYMTIGNEGGDMLGGAQKLSALLEERGPKDFHWKFKHMPEETHGSIPFLSTYEGLLFIFEEWEQQ